MRKQLIAVVLVMALGISTIMPIHTIAATSYDVRKKVVSVTGIMIATSSESTVTRGQYARMLVNASEYQGVVGTSNSLSLFLDVPNTSEYAPYIRVAVEKQWMTGYLGGVFKPDQALTLQEAIKGVLALLGYSDSDFAGNIVAGRLELYYSKQLDSKIGKEALDTVTMVDCINLFYNLLKADTKQGNMYGKLFDCTLTSDGEINCLDLANNSVVGPTVATGDLKSDLPFSLSNATFFKDGSSCEEEDINQGDVLYYHKGTKTAWAYESMSDAGTVEAIYYDANSPMSPTGIRLNSTDYKLNSTDLKFAFSTYGDVEVGDEITIIYETTGLDENESYQIIDYMKE